METLFRQVALGVAVYGLPAAAAVFAIVWAIFRPRLQISVAAFVSAVAAYTLGAMLVYDTPADFQANGFMFTVFVTLAVSALAFSFAGKIAAVATSAGTASPNNGAGADIGFAEPMTLELTPWKRLALVAMAVFALAWFFRYDVTPISAGDRAGAYVVDRLTGKISLYAGNKYYETEWGGN
ncbi:hypothetical protein I6F11_04085 [Ensifer sp. NBAIM29]|nr:hypothetical protein [Ensifer sp. NBAIM29]